MIHVIIILHFLCFALGIGVITSILLDYKNNKKDILKNVLIEEVLFSILFLIDSIGIYARKILEQYKIENIMRGINYFLLVITIFYLCKIIGVVRKEKLYMKSNIFAKIIMYLFLFIVLCFLLSFKVEFLKHIPYLCIGYLLQCILVIIYISKNTIPDVKTNIISETNKIEDKEYIVDVSNKTYRQEKQINKDAVREKENITHDRNELLKCLTDREKEVVTYLCMGLSNKEIGSKLFISPNTVKNHVYNIYKKMNVKNKVELINLMNKPLDE